MALFSFGPARGRKRPLKFGPKRPARCQRRWQDGPELETDRGGQWRMAPLFVLGSALRQLRPAPTTAAPALVASLGREAPLGRALREVGPTLARVAVREAARGFDSGAVALLIVDVRDSLGRQLYDAALALQAKGELALAHAVASAVQRLEDDTFSQHLVNAVLEATGLYTEAQPFERGVVALRRVEDAVTALLERSLCVLLTRNEAARTVRSAAEAPVFSWPPSTVVRG